MRPNPTLERMPPRHRSALRSADRGCRCIARPFPPSSCAGQAPNRTRRALTVSGGGPLRAVRVSLSSAPAGRDSRSSHGRFHGPCGGRCPRQSAEPVAGANERPATQLAIRMFCGGRSFAQLVVRHFYIVRHFISPRRPAAFLSATPELRLGFDGESISALCPRLGIREGIWLEHRTSCCHALPIRTLRQNQPVQRMSFRLFGSDILRCIRAYSCRVYTSMVRRSSLTFLVKRLQIAHWFAVRFRIFDFGARRVSDVAIHIQNQHFVGADWVLVLFGVADFANHFELFVHIVCRCSPLNKSLKAKRRAASSWQSDALTRRLP